MTAPTARLLRDRTAVVTGAARGIGFSIATRFAEHGADVALLDLDEEATGDAAERIARATGARTMGLAADVSDEDGLGAAATEVESTLGVVDVVVPNAGILVLKPAVELERHELDAVLRVNLVGAFLTATTFARRMVATRTPGRILFTSSLFGTRGGAGNAAYSASKFAVIGLAQSMAAELAGDGIRVNAVCPGQIDSVMLDQLFRERASAAGTTAEEEHARFVSHIPLGRLGLPEEVADTYVYLASDLSSYVTGEHVVVDGGWRVG